MCSYYVSWFGRCYRKGDAGWFAYTTPDGRPVALQDAFMWNAMEVICRELNVQIAVEQAKYAQR